MISDTCDLAANLACPALPSGPVFNLATASSNFCSKATKNSCANLSASCSSACPERIGALACALIAFTNSIPPIF